MPIAPLPDAPAGRPAGAAGPALPDASAQVPDVSGTQVPGSGGVARWVRAAVTPRMLGMLVLLLVAAAVCARLGVWQLDRAQVRGAAAEQRREAALTTAAPVPLDQVLAPQTAFTGALVGRKVQVSGTYDAAQQLLVTGRAVDGRHGSLVLTPLHVGTAQGQAVLAVVRGFVPDGATDAAVAPAPPPGPVSVVGYLQSGEAPGAGVVDGRTEAISPAELVGVWGGPTWTGYLVLASSDPAQGSDPTPLPPPTRHGTGLNVQNLSYAAQWWIFGGFALLLWWRMVRDEARGNPFDDERGEPAEVAGGPGDGGVPAEGGRPAGP